MDFVKALEGAQKVPEDTNQGFNPFAPLFPPETQVVDTTNDDPHAIPGVPKWELTFHCRRFYTGRELVEVLEGGAKVFGDRDETAEYMAVMNKIVAGTAIQLHKHQTILGEGSVVIWLEWAEKKMKDTTQFVREGRLTEEQLTSPDRVTPRSREADAGAEAETEDAGEEDESGPNFNDEEDW